MHNDEHHGPSVAIDSGDVRRMRDLDNGQFLSLLNEKHRLRVHSKFYVTVMALLALASFGKTSSWLAANKIEPGTATGAAAYVACLILLFLVGEFFHGRYKREVKAKSIRLEFNANESQLNAFTGVSDALLALPGAAVFEQIDSEAQVTDGKYHAGAGSLTRSSAARCLRRLPPYFESNVTSVELSAGAQTLYFFPDRVLVYANVVGSVSYMTLNVDATNTVWITGTPPHDAPVVGTTHKYVNKSGGPDRRFKDNPELAKCRFEVLSLSSSTGLREMYRCSKPGVAVTIKSRVEELVRQPPVALPKVGTAQEGEPQTG